MVRLFCLVVGLLVSSVLFSGNEHIDVSGFSSHGLSKWESHSFEGETHYSLHENKRGAYVRAISLASASGLVREIDVDLDQTPILTWRWRVNERLPKLDETGKSGDDYAARVYVVVSGGLFFWRTKALNFVWSSRDEVPHSWPNAFAPDNALMRPLRGAKDQTGVWYQEKINIAQELKSWLGEDIDEIHAVAIMTDTDNSAFSASADYADIRFLEK